jgi:hypothetical protein
MKNPSDWLISISGQTDTATVPSNATLSFTKLLKPPGIREFFIIDKC